MTIKSDNGPQFRSYEFGEYCDCQMGTGQWRSRKTECVNHETCTYSPGVRSELEERTADVCAKYHGLPHSTTGKSPAELNYNRKFRGKLPDFTLENRDDLDVRDQAAELKGLSKMHVDKRRGARYTNVDVGDEVLVRQGIMNKLSTTFKPTQFVVVRKSGNSLIVESPDGVQYSRNSSMARRFHIYSLN